MVHPENDGLRRRWACLPRQPRISITLLTLREITLCWRWAGRTAELSSFLSESQSAFSWHYHLGAKPSRQHPGAWGRS